MRFLDLLSLTFLFFVSALIVASNSRSLIIIPLLVLLVISLFLLLLFNLIKRFKGRFSTLGLLFSFFNQVLSVRKVLILIFYSILNWIFKFISFHFILIGGGVELSFFQTVFVSTFGEITTVLPIHSFGGFGTYEAGLVGGFKLLGLKATYSLTVAFYFHLILLTMSSILFFLGWFYLWFKLRRV